MWERNGASSHKNLMKKMKNEEEEDGCFVGEKRGLKKILVEKKNERDLRVCCICARVAPFFINLG